MKDSDAIESTKDVSFRFLSSYGTLFLPVMLNFLPKQSMPPPTGERVAKKISVLNESTKTQATKRIVNRVHFYQSPLP